MQTDPCFSVKQHRGHVCTRKDDDNGQGKAILRHLGAILWRFGPISWPFCGALGPSHRHHHHLGAILCALGPSRSHVGAILRKRLDLILQGAHRSLKTNAFEAISGQSWCYFGAILGPSDSNLSRCAPHLENGPCLDCPEALLEPSRKHLAAIGTAILRPVALHRLSKTPSCGVQECIFTSANILQHIRPSKGTTLSPS